jgi:hypothetical protein
MSVMTGPVFRWSMEGKKRTAEEPDKEGLECAMLFGTVGVRD